MCLKSLGRPSQLFSASLVSTSTQGPQGFGFRVIRICTNPPHGPAYVSQRPLGQGEDRVKLSQDRQMQLFSICTQMQLHPLPVYLCCLCWWFHCGCLAVERQCWGCQQPLLVISLWLFGSGKAMLRLSAAILDPKHTKDVGIVPRLGLTWTGCSGYRTEIRQARIKK